MPDTTTTPETTTDAQDNWEQRYVGLQKVVAKRDTDLTAANVALDSLRAENEAANVELLDYRQKAVDESEDEAARTQYDQLRARFDPAPKPVGNNPARPHWTDGGDRQDQGDLDPSRGYPV